MNRYRDDCEMACAVAPDTTENAMRLDDRYRTHSSAWQPTAPRTTYPHDPVSYEPTWLERLVRWIAGH